MKTIEISAPSNIALIKYMGKTDVKSNIPTNPSMSYTVDYLKTHIEITENNVDDWQLLDGYYPLALSEEGKEKFLRFFLLLKNELQIAGNFLLKSANTFPADAGLASSASSFAALTKGAWELCKLQHGDRAQSILLKNSDLQVNEALARISRLGSGSSCRSFFEGFCKWEKERVTSMNFPYKDLHHIVFLLEEGKKEVSSSDAHRRVPTSPNFLNRIQRAEDRQVRLEKSLLASDWDTSRKIVWDEFIDMHNLFETADPPFSFITDESKKLLAALLLNYEKDGSGPIVTMDAGPNIHLFFNNEQKQMFLDYKTKYSNYKMMSSNET